MEVKSEFLRCFSNLVSSYVNVWFWTRGSRGEVPGKKKEGTAGGISGGGSFSLDEKGSLVFGV